MELFGNFGFLMKSHKCWSSESDFALDSFPKLDTCYVQDNCNSSELITVLIVCQLLDSNTSSMRMQQRNCNTETTSVDYARENWNTETISVRMQQGNCKQNHTFFLNRKHIICSCFSAIQQGNLQDGSSAISWPKEKLLRFNAARQDLIPIFSSSQSRA